MAGTRQTVQLTGGDDHDVPACTAHGAPRVGPMDPFAVKG